MKEKFFSFIIKHRFLFLALLLGITLFFGWFASQVKFNNTIETYFFKDDLEDYNRFLDQFGTDEIIVIAFETENAFSIENLDLIDRISGMLEKLPHVRRVLSLTTARIVHGEEDTVGFDRLIDEIPSTPQELRLIRERALDDPIIPGTLVSRDGRNTAIIAEVDHLVGEFDYKVELLNQIKVITREEEARTGKHFSIGGTAVLDDAVFRYTQKDQVFSSALMTLAIVLLMFMIFRQVGITILPLLVVLVTTIWTYGFLVLLGFQLNVISTIIGPLILAVGVADSMHIISDYLQKISEGNSNKGECIGHSFSDLLTPCFMTSVTTILGLLSLLMADLAPLREFGLVSAGGVFFAFVVSIILLPILLYFFPLPKEKHQDRIQRGIMARLLLWLGRWQRGRATFVLLIVGFLIVPAAISLGRLGIGTNTLDYFKKNDPVRLQTEWIDANIGGTTSLEFLIDAHEEDALKQPTLLKNMEQFQSYLEDIDGVTGVYSAVDLVKALNKAFNGGDERKFIVPSSYAEVTQQLFIIEGSEDFEEFLSNDYSKGRIMARVEINKSQELAHKMPEIEKRMNEIFEDRAGVVPTGLVYLMHKMESYILSSQIKSFLIAFIVIVIALMAMLRSFGLGILAMIPNFLPIMFTMALMPALGISLDIGTVMVAGIALGLVVDDTIHLLSRLSFEMNQDTDIRTGLANAINQTGRPIIYTSVILCVGFGVMVFASFNPVISFGILSSIVILFALIFDLVVLPAAFGFAKGFASQRSD